MWGLGGELIVKPMTNNPFDSYPLFGNRRPVADTLGPELLSDAFCAGFSGKSPPTESN